MDREYQKDWMSMNAKFWLLEKIGNMERLSKLSALSANGEGALSAFRECLEQVDARSPTDQEIDEIIDTALREGTPRHRVRRHLRALFGEGPNRLPPMTDEQILDHVPVPVLECLQFTARGLMCAWVRRLLRDGRLG